MSFMDTSDLPTADTEVVLMSIKNKLDLLVPLHNEIKDLGSSVDFMHRCIEKHEAVE